jgi:hypothetical protein
LPGFVPSRRQFPDIAVKFPLPRLGKGRGRIGFYDEEVWDRQALLSRNLEPLNPAVSLPELYVVIVHNFPSVVFGAFIVWAEKPNHPAKLPVCSNDAHLIFDHQRSPRPSSGAKSIFMRSPGRILQSEEAQTKTVATRWLCLVVRRQRRRE